MLLIPPILLLAVLTGFVAGGSLRRFEDLSVHWWFLAFLGLGLQVIPLPTVGQILPACWGRSCSSCPTPCC